MEGAVLYGVTHSPWVEGVRLAMAHASTLPPVTSHPHSLSRVWHQGLVFPALRLADGSIHGDSFHVYSLLEAAGQPLGLAGVPAADRDHAQAELERLFLTYAPGRCIEGRRWRFITAWSQMREHPYTPWGVLSRAFVSIYFFVLIRLGIRLTRARGRPVYDLARIENQIQAWDARLADTPWLTAAAPGFLDFALLGHIQCMASGLTDELLPILRRQEHLMSWLARMLEGLRDVPDLHARRVLEPDLTLPRAGSGEQALFWFAWACCLWAWPLTGAALLLLLARRPRNPGHSGAVIARQRAQKSPTAPSGD